MGIVSKSIDRLRTKASSFVKDTSGNIAIMAAILLPAIVAVSAVAIDYSSTSNSNSKLQQAADNSAIASAREMVLPNASAETIQAVAENYVAANLASSKGFFSTKPTVLASVDKELGTVKISITGIKQNAFGGFLQPETTTLNVSAVARSLSGSHKTCVIVLEKNNASALEMKNSSQLVAKGCHVQSNSVATNGITLKNSSKLTASSICTSGGISMQGGLTSVNVITDCPTIDDPLAYKIPPSVGSCDHTNLTFSGDDNALLDPGVYCGGLLISDNAVVDLRPGTYIFKDGPLKVAGNSEFTGKNVGLFFLGDESGLNITKLATVELTAPKSGAMAGLLMFSDRGNTPAQAFKISSNFTRVLLGTIYLPNAKLWINSGNIVGDKSAYTVIVARQFWTSGTPDIVINSNYDSTDIPVPDGVGPGDQKIVLVK